MNVEGIFQEAYEILIQFSHEYMTLEHVVLALIKDKEIKKVLKNVMWTCPIRSRRSYIL